MTSIGHLLTPASFQENIQPAWNSFSNGWTWQTGWHNYQPLTLTRVSIGVSEFLTRSSSNLQDHELIVTGHDTMHRDDLLDNAFGEDSDDGAPAIRKISRLIPSTSSRVAAGKTHPNSSPFLTVLPFLPPLVHSILPTRSAPMATNATFKPVRVCFM
jgi:hypothetical protein